MVNYLASACFFCVATLLALLLQGCWSVQTEQQNDGSTTTELLSYHVDGNHSWTESDSEAQNGSENVSDKMELPHQQDQGLARFGIVNLNPVRANLANLSKESRAYSNLTEDLAELTQQDTDSGALQSRPTDITPPAARLGKGHLWDKETTLEELRDKQKQLMLGIGGGSSTNWPVKIEAPVSGEMHAELAAPSNSSKAEDTSTSVDVVLPAPAGAEEVHGKVAAAQDVADAQSENSTLQKASGSSGSNSTPLPAAKDLDPFSETEGPSAAIETAAAPRVTMPLPAAEAPKDIFSSGAEVAIEGTLRDFDGSGQPRVHAEVLSLLENDVIAPKSFGSRKMGRLEELTEVHEHSQ
eukprot:CAMPEP_0197663780 /NCGR_PEP_ID=MMETSP1338-20131121/58233_1 /TAXON_ID=43686 ORGANISM="Pelagodinium beii, Strain RCC1491" /NCGR_SAMPLE_ID=MMETSP1338 /ASSEMBLY_ACC=CAM_ASM_000754 /LENGTH=353 /DNA_ID=CAMNT_0043242275 /DNA_START=84 /DNA_END=1145 /DNA_ORIENTATION=+